MYDITIVLGDYNAKTGKENFMENVARRFSLPEETSGNAILLGHLATM
jgi:hypothetical protein